MTIEAESASMRSPTLPTSTSMTVVSNYRWRVASRHDLESAEPLGTCLRCLTDAGRFEGHHVTLDMLVDFAVRQRRK